MKAFRITVLSLALIAGAARPGLAAEEGTPVRPNRGFDLMKGLVGSWEAKTKDGVVSVRYEIVSGGTALMETMSHPGDTAAMITVYHPNGDQLMMTHYCGANNQPRMRCAGPAPDGKRLAFEYVDCTNLPSPEIGHMHGLTLTMVDADHLTQEWIWKEGAKSDTEAFHFERKKS
jgi:hypothetical protein